MEVKFREWNCHTIVSRYKRSGNTSIELMDSDSQAIIAKVTVGVGTQLPQNTIAIRHEEIADALLKAGVIENRTESTAFEMLGISLYTLSEEFYNELKTTLDL